MKLSNIPVVLAAAAGLVSAAPIRIVVVTSNQRVPALPAWAQGIQWGHAAAPAFDLPPLEAGHPIPVFAPNPTHTPLPTDDQIRPISPMMRKGGCRGGMRSKSMQLGNKLRVILGLPPINDFHRSSFVVETIMNADGSVTNERFIPVNTRLPTHHHRHNMRPQHHRTPFMIRLSYALASLGPWEGRAVSFVLGCGLGVLLRMLFVFGVLIVRSVRAQREESQVALEEDSVIFIADVKEPINVETLPEYAEKSETEEAPQTNNSH